MTSVHEDGVVRIFPAPHQSMPLHGLYLHQDIALDQEKKIPFVYANYVVSMDGRIALSYPETNEKKIPPSIANESDWRLYQELAAQADVLVTSGTYIRDFAEGHAKSVLPITEQREFADLLQWRSAHGLSLQPAVAVVTSRLDLPWKTISEKLNRPVFAVTTANATDADVHRLKSIGVHVIHAGDDDRVTGKLLVAGLANHGLYNIYVIAGPKVLGTLIEDNALDRLYLTQVHKLVGGSEFDTFLETAALESPTRLKLRCLYQNVSPDRAIEQSFAIFDVDKRHNVLGVK